MAQGNKGVLIATWILRVVVAAVFVMAAIPKLTGNDGSVAMFDILGAEPFGRYVAGVTELVGAVLVLVPLTTALGALIAIGVMLGAIFAHATKLGISIDPQRFPEHAAALTQAGLEGPTMFGMALLVLVFSIVLVVLERRNLPIIGGAFRQNAPVS